MIKKNNLYNFDAFSDFSHLLWGKNFLFPLNKKNLAKIPRKDQVKAISIKTSSKVTPEVLKPFPHLKLLITRTVGLDHLPVKKIEQQNITIKNIPDYGAFSVAEHVFALLLTLTRKVIFLDKDVRKGIFSSQGAKGFSLEGKTFGIIGAGRIGLEIIKLAKAFRMKVLAFDMYPNQALASKIGFSYTTLNDILENSDIISLNVPLTPQTKYLIAEKQIKLMKKKVILINTSRGAVIDTKALIKNIEKFKYVGLDVLEDEQEFSKNHPLLNFKNVVITPHCAFFTDKSSKNIAQKAKEIAQSFKYE